MKINKHLKELINKATLESFDNSGSINPKSVEKITKSFKTLPTSEAIVALNEYLKGVKRTLYQNTLTIESTKKLNRQDLQKIHQHFKKSHKISSAQNLINQGLLGGIKISLGDLSLDDSLNRKFEKIGEEIERQR